MWFLPYHTLDVRVYISQTCLQCFKETGDMGLFREEDCAAMQQKQSGTRWLRQKEPLYRLIKCKKVFPGKRR